MAEHTYNILKELEQYPVDPPAYLFDKIWAKLQQEKDAKKLNDATQTIHTLIQNSEIVENEGQENGLSAEEPAILSFLKEYEVKPAYDIDQIAGLLHTVENKGAVIVSKKVFLKSVWYKVAAAAILTGFCVWVFFPDTGKTKLAAIPVVTDSSTIKNNKLVHTKDPVQAKPTQSHNKAAQEELASQHKNMESEQVSEHQQGLRFIDSYGQQQFENQDILYTLVNFRYRDQKKFQSRLTKDKKLSIDKYSYVNVSDKMAAMLAKTYAVKRNKKSSRKARRVKAKIEKWKKLDEKHFDSGIKKNPIDILDLSEFIF